VPARYLRLVYQRGRCLRLGCCQGRPRRQQAVAVESVEGKKDLVARFGGIPLKHDRRAVIGDPAPIRNGYPRKELIHRLRKRACELSEQAPRRPSTRSLGGGKDSLVCLLAEDLSGRPGRPRGRGRMAPLGGGTHGWDIANL